MAKQSQPSGSLSEQAFRPLRDGERYRPVVGDAVQMPELSARSVIVGLVVGILFGTANAYLGLKVGLTVSASIPAAVMGVAVFRALRGGSLLESNMVQTVGSAGESLAAGVIFTLPVLFLWRLDASFWPIFPLALLGGLLGVLFMIPLRRVLIVEEHGHLPYPEGTACAEVQVTAHGGSAGARSLFAGLAAGGIFTLLEKVVKLWPATADLPLRLGGYRTSVGAEVTPELVGVGFIVGPRVAAVMLAGGAVGWLVIIPLLYFVGAHVAGPVPPETATPIVAMGSFDVWSRYLRYIGAGAVAFGGSAALVKSAPTIVRSIASAGRAASGKRRQPRRTDQDLPTTTIILGIAGCGILAALLPLMVGGGSLGPVAGIAVVVFAFFFVTVSSRVVGLVGSSSNPISGMTIATVLLCALLFGGAYAGDQARVAVLTIGALVCIAAAIAGDTSQDLKTGHLLGATPARQQIGELIGVLGAAIAMSTVLALFREQIVSGAFKAPQAHLIQLVIDGVLSGDLPWPLVLVGMALAACVELLGLPTLAFAVGLYLPIHLAVPIGLGGLLRRAVETDAARGDATAEARRERGILFGSGLIAGAATIGVGLAALRFYDLPTSLFETEVTGAWGGLTALFAMGLAVFWKIRR